MSDKTSNPSFLQFLAQALRQRTLSPSPPGFDEFNAPPPPPPPEPTEFEKMKQGIKQRKEYLN